MPASAQAPPAPKEEPASKPAKCEEGDLTCLNQKVEAMNGELDEILRKLKKKQTQAPK